MEGRDFGLKTGPRQARPFLASAPQLRLYLRGITAEGTWGATPKTARRVGPERGGNGRKRYGRPARKRIDDCNQRLPSPEGPRTRNAGIQTAAPCAMCRHRGGNAAGPGLFTNEESAAFRSSSGGT